MTKRNGFIWNAIHAICWFIFAALCVQAGTLLFNYLYSLFRPIAMHNLHEGLNLWDLYSKSATLYHLLFWLIILLSLVKAVVFYHVLRLFQKLKLVQPFTEVVASCITEIGYNAFVVGCMSVLAHQLTKKLAGKGYQLSVIERYWNDADAYLMMAAILFVIALIFRKGIDLQNENDLTV